MGNVIWAALILAAAIAAAGYAVLLAVHRLLLPAATAPLSAPPACPDCTRNDSLLIVEHAGTRRYSCQHCPCVYSVTRDGLTFKHHARSLPFSPQIPDPQDATTNGPRPAPKRFEDRPIPRARPTA